MTGNMRLAVGIVFALILVGQGSARAIQQDVDRRAPVFVNASVDDQDSVGARLVTAVRERLAKSALFRLVSSSQVGSLELDLVTLRATDVSIASQAICIHVDAGLLLARHDVRTIGTTKVEQVADEIVADLDAVVRRMK